MAIPDYQSLMLPLLEFVGDSQAHSNSEAIEYLSNKFRLSTEDRAVRSGSHNRFEANFSWAKTYLKKAGLIESPSTRQFKITELGKKVLSSKPPRIDNDFLKNFDSFKEWNTWGDAPNVSSTIRESNAPLGQSKAVVNEKSDELIPEEQIERGYREISGALAEELLEKVKSCPPSFFEHLVVELLVKMGYGGSLKKPGETVGKSGDGGIDGIIKEDKLGLDIIYIQAKRWESVVGAGPVRDFSGSLDPHGAKKGVFITTSAFTKDARAYATNLGGKKIVLVDGFELAQLMIDHDIGVSTVTTYTIKRLDSDYFEE